MTDQLYTSSRIRVIRTCARLHHYRYDLGIQSQPNADTEFGTVGHAALEAYFRAWKSGDLDGRLADAVPMIRESELGEFDRAKLEILVAAYHERWGGEDWEILAVEQEFRYQLGEHLIGGKIDAIIRDRRDARVYVLEHKLTGLETSLGGVYWERLALDSQVSIYIDGASMLGYDVAGCIYDVIKRPQHDQLLATPQERREYTKGKGCKRCGGSAGGKAGIVKGRGHYDVVFGPEVKRVDCDECKGTGWKCDVDGVPQAPRLHTNQRECDETIEEFEDRLLGVIAESLDSWLQRSIVVRLDDELPAMRADVVDTIAIHRLCVNRDSHPRNPDACAKYGRMCELFDACTGRADINNTQRFPRGRAHPELAAT